MFFFKHSKQFFLSAADNLSYFYFSVRFFKLFEQLQLIGYMVLVNIFCVISRAKCYPKYYSSKKFYDNRFVFGSIQVSTDKICGLAARSDLFSVKSQFGNGNRLLTIDQLTFKSLVELCCDKITPAKWLQEY